MLTSSEIIERIDTIIRCSNDNEVLSKLIDFYNTELRKMREYTCITDNVNVSVDTQSVRYVMTYQGVGNTKSVIINLTDYHVTVQNKGATEIYDRYGRGVVFEDKEHGHMVSLGKHSFGIYIFSIQHDDYICLCRGVIEDENDLKFAKKTITKMTQMKDIDYSFTDDWYRNVNPEFILRL